MVEGGDFFLGRGRKGSLCLVFVWELGRERGRACEGIIVFILVQHLSM